MHSGIGSRSRALSRGRADILNIWMALLGTTITLPLLLPHSVVASKLSVRTTPRFSNLTVRSSNIPMELELNESRKVLLFYFPFHVLLGSLNYCNNACNYKMKLMISMNFFWSAQTQLNGWLNSKAWIFILGVRNHVFLFILFIYLV